MRSDGSSAPQQSCVILQPSDRSAAVGWSIRSMHMYSINHSSSNMQVQAALVSPLKRASRFKQVMSQALPSPVFSG
eukprot:49957-Eustigmatos_ZCMA.PRE.1